MPRAQNTDVTDVLECPRCGVALADGEYCERGEVRRAKGTDLCMDCAIEMDGVGAGDGMTPEDYDHA